MLRLKIMIAKKSFSAARLILLACIFHLLFFSFSAHADNATLVVESRPLLHTFVEIKAYGDNARQAIEEAFAEMERVNALLNNYDPDSEVSNISRHAGGDPVRISPESMEALQSALKFGNVSGGALDITIGPLLKLWGFAKEEPGLEGAEPGAGDIKKAKELVDYKALELSGGGQGETSVRTARLKKSGMWIDVGSFSKGYCADRAMAALRKRGIANALVAAGGTICAMGCKPDGSLWKVGIRHPRKDDFMTFLFLKDASVSTSGDYEKYYKNRGKRRAHIIDPRTGRPVERMQSVTVIASSGVESDCLSTSLFVLGPEKGIRLVDGLSNASALIVSHKGAIHMSKAWPQKIVIY